MEEIDADFDPMKMKEKWMRFFKSGITKVMVDTDRALKNDINENMFAFVKENKYSFTERQIMKALKVLSGAYDAKFVVEKDQLVTILSARILQGNAEFKNSAIHYEFADALNVAYEYMFQ